MFRQTNFYSVFPPKVDCRIFIKIWPQRSFVNLILFQLLRLTKEFFFQFAEELDEADGEEDGEDEDDDDLDEEDGVFFVVLFVFISCIYLRSRTTDSRSILVLHT